MNDQNKNGLVVLDNKLIRASYRLTVNEIRLILVAISQMPREDEQIDPKKPYYITKEDFVRLGVDPKNVAREIRSACNDLLNRTLVMNTPLGEFGIHWVQSVLNFKTEIFERLKLQYPNFDQDDEFVESLRRHNLLDSLPVIANSNDNVVARVVLHEDIIPYLSELKQQFTQLMLDDMAGFASFYSYRIYLMMMQFRSTGYCKIRLGELREALGLKDKYEATKDLKKWVIETAVKEINEKSPYQVSYKMLKTGRKFTDLEIRFKPKKSASKAIAKRNSTTFEHQPINAEKTPSWQRKGLSDAQIKKLAIYKDQFVEANTHLLRDKNISYYEAFEDFKDQLKDPEQVGKFHLLAEFLALKKGDEPPKAPKEPAQSKKKPSKATAEVSKNRGLTAEQIDFFATHPQFQMDHPVKGYEVGSEAQISYLKLGLGSRPADFFETDFNKYLK